MATRKHAIGTMTHVEFREWQDRDPVIIIPVASHEQHGPQDPMGDYVLAEKMALMAAEAAEAIVAPAVPFGYSDTFRCMPGGIQFRPETFRAVLEDVIDAFLPHGMRRILIFNGHHGNAALIHHVTHKVRREHGVIIPSLNFWGIVPASFPGIAGPPGGKGHGGEPMSSVYKHLCPGDVRPDLAAPATARPVLGLDARSLASVAFEGGQVEVPLVVTDINDLGMFGGDGLGATAEYGKAVVDHIVGYTARLVRYLRSRDPGAIA